MAAERSDTSSQIEWRLKKGQGAWESVRVPDTWSASLLPDDYFAEARELATGGRQSEWTSRKYFRVKPTAADIRSYGSLPGAPRNVIVRKQGETLWRLAWDPPTDVGGWAITKYYYGDTGNDRRCGDGSWPFRQFSPDDQPPSALPGGYDGRQYALNVRVGIGGGTNTLSISAVNAKGEGACVAGAR